MTKQEAIAEAVERVDRSGNTQYVMARGTKYEVWGHPYRPGYRVAEMIGTGNVNNYRSAPSAKEQEQ